MSRIKLPLHRLLGEDKEGMMQFWQEPQDDFHPSTVIIIPLDQLVEVQVADRFSSEFEKVRQQITS